MNTYTLEYRYVRGHVEIYLDGAFVCSADNMSEALDEMTEMQMEDAS